MRSYYEHLETAMGVKTPIPPHPITRSSAIFPVFNLPGIQTRIIFMGYWLLKRNIHEILAVVNLRSIKGKLLGRQTFSIKEAKTYRIELRDQLKNGGLDPEQEFTGSLEVEFFSSVNLVFPFPAVVVNYYGSQFSTVVHTAQRVYNDFEDLKRNSQTQVPESGFNIYADEEKEPFIGLINGAEGVEEGIFTMEFFNLEKQTLRHTLKLGKLEPYETRILYPAQEVDLKSFLKGSVGAGKARFRVNWIFPRLLVGNLQPQLPGLMVTHTYYDTSLATSESDYWRASEPTWFPASLMIPSKLDEEHFTHIYFYPIYSPSTFVLDVEFYNERGELQGRKGSVLQITSPAEEFYRIELKQLAKEMGLDTRLNQGTRIIARTIEGSRLPARIKIGLDVGVESHMPCNICTNLQPFNPALESKPTTFRWGPILSDQSDPAIWVMNSAPHVDYKRKADITMTFHREKDAETMTRLFTLSPHGFRVLYPNEDPELKEFLGGQIGWFTLISTNPYTSTYYFVESPAGIIGGDHGF